MNLSAASEPKRPGVGLGMTIVLGLLATLFFGVVGAFGWLLWVWWRTPDDVRASVSTTKKGAVIAVASLSLVTTALGFVMTAIALRRAFDRVATIDPADKARTLAEGISNAMNWTVVGLIPVPIAVAVCFFSGYRLLRATRERGRVLTTSARTR